MATPERVDGRVQTSGGAVEAVRAWLPAGRTLPENVWNRRHRWILTLLWLHALAIPVVGVLSGEPLPHAAGHGLAIAAIALTSHLVPGRRTRAGIVSVGLLTSSALLIHASGGYTEAHFHFFVMIAVLALYEDWVPFLLAVAYVAVHHGVFGVLSPESVYGNPAAQESPWTWALIHGGFVLAAGIANIASWRMNEDMRTQSQDESARRAQAETLAATLQQGLRPARLPELDAGEVGARYLPAGAGVIGGDWYDVTRLDDGRLVLALGDMAGRGVEAASHMAALRHAARAYALEGFSPTAIAERLDRLVEGEFATFVLAVVDPVAERLTWVNAGHLPPLVLDPAGTPSFLDRPSCVPLGAGFAARFCEGEAPFPLGSTLLLYTDGLVERRDRAIDQGLAVLAAALDGQAGTPDDLCRHAVDRLLDERPDADDDVALLAFRSAPATPVVMSAADTAAAAPAAARP